MKTTADYIVSGFAKIDADLNYLMKCLKEVLVELGEHKAAEFLPWQEGGQAHNIDDPPPRIEQAYSIAFQLLNMVEENASTQTRRLREIEHGLSVFADDLAWHVYVPLPDEDTLVRGSRPVNMERLKAGRPRSIW